MISIIICSRSKDISQVLKNNIAKTIGCPYELIIIDNSTNQYSIFSAYNKGAQQSKFAYLCFMHDDILYQTNNWGDLIKNHFNDKKTGAIGIAGTPYMPHMPGSWWGGELVNEYLFAEPVVIKQCPETESSKNEVVALDGLWFCIRKSLFCNIRFDDINYAGFHFYDIDICLQIKQAGFNIYSVFDILLQHFSTGYADINWQKNALIFHEKWKLVLPVSCLPLKYIDRCEAELKTIDEFTLISITNKESKKDAYRFAFLALLKHRGVYFYSKTFFSMGKYLFKFLIIN